MGLVENQLEHLVRMCQNAMYASEEDMAAMGMTLTGHSCSTFEIALWIGASLINPQARKPANNKRAKSPTDQLSVRRFCFWSWPPCYLFAILVTGVPRSETDCTPAGATNCSHNQDTK